MDATLAIANWWTLCKEMGLELNGYVFRTHRHGSDEVGAMAHQRLVSRSSYLSISPVVCNAYLIATVIRSFS